MAELESETEGFSRLVEALRPWLDRVVFIGGWAHRLYRLHPLARPPGHPPLTTRDADIAITARALPAEVDLSQVLRAAGFSEELSGDHSPPVTHYRLGANDGAFSVEFLTPLIGGELTRTGRMNATMEIVGVTAQKLRHLELLMIAPWSVTLSENNGFSVAPPIGVRIPNAASYMAQKILIHRKRRRDQQPKDLLYIHDTIETFSASLEKVRNDWVLHVKPSLHVRALKRIERFASGMFAKVSDPLREAAREAAAASGRTLTAEAVAEVCRAGLKEIYGR